MAKKEKKYRWGECPKRCSGRSASWQRSLNRSEVEQLKEVGVSDASEHLKRCMYCGCVYTTRGKTLGWLDGMDHGWKPAKGGSDQVSTYE